jgi:hypothetical protein
MMSEVERIERQIQNLDDESFAQLRQWFVEYDHARWDRQIETDAAAGKLDFLIDEALTEHRDGKTRPL